MARNRQRAKQRKRKAQEQDSSAPEPVVPSPVPGVFPDQPGVAPSQEIPELDDPQPGDDALLQAEEEAAAEHPEVVPEEAREKPGERQKGPRFWNFLKACWAELQRVQWPDRTQVAQATAVVLGFVVVAGAYLGLADAAAKEIVDFIL